MLTSTADSALRLDGALSDSAAEAGAEPSGLGFGEVLNGITQPATNSQPGAKLRHVPAGISVLSGVSQALLAAANAENDSAAGADEGSLLASSLLGQIALKDKLPETGSETEATTGSDADTTDSADAGAAEDTPVAVLPGTNQPEADATKAVKTAEHLQQSADEITDTATEAQVKANSQIAAEITPVNVADKTEAAAGGKGDAQPVAELQAGGNKTASPDDTELAAGAGSDKPILGDDNQSNGGKAAIDTAVKTDVSLVKTDDNSIKASTVTPQTAQADTKMADADNAAQITATGLTATGSPDNNKTEADSAITTSRPTLTAASDKTDSQTGGKAAAESNASKHDAQHGSSQQGSSQQNPSQNSSAQQGSSQQHSSQQQLRQNNDGQPADGSVAVPDSSVATAKVAADTSTVARSETAFGSALHVAEQRQQASPAQTVARPLAEQLKQSLNLLQQDAAGQLRERVSFMVRQNIQIAEIRLDPAGLGQMQIKIDMQQDQASVQFIVQQSQAKELLEQQLPRLREMLQQQGIQLTEGQVQQQSQQERQLAQRDSNHSGSNGKHTADDSQDGQAETVQLNVKTSDRLVDYYA
ncbi:flagellar hook-length control protein FliK [Rheinheimera pacifica]|nr:flagellar hook-length control protein FliK [Rheinheimera pacifica]